MDLTPLLKAQRDSSNLNIVLKIVSTPVSKSHGCSNFSAREQDAACKGEIGKYQLSKEDLLHSQPSYQNYYC
jgi:hypothetical protein